MFQDRGGYASDFLHVQGDGMIANELLVFGLDLIVAEFVSLPVVEFLVNLIDE